MASQCPSTWQKCFITEAEKVCCIIADYTEILHSYSAVQFGVSRVIRENLKANQQQSVGAAAHWYKMRRQLVEWTAGVPVLQPGRRAPYEEMEDTTKRQKKAHRRNGDTSTGQRRGVNLSDSRNMFSKYVRRELLTRQARCFSSQ